jgi:hypothetical protein
MPTTYKKKVISVKRTSSANKSKGNIRTTKTGRKFKVFKTESPKRNISVMIVPANDTFKQKVLSPKYMTTKSGRVLTVYPKQTKSSKSGLVFSIQTVLPGSRPPMNK